MPLLKNARHERFAQEVAKGKTATEAYELAGYKPHDGNAATLRGNKRVAARLAELLQRGAAKAEVTIYDIAKQLDEDRALAHEVKQAGAAVSASAAKAKLFGHMRERMEHSGPNGGAIKHDLSGIPDEKLAQLEAILGSNPNARRGKSGDKEPAGEAER